MRLHRLALQNFRQHADTELVFRPGLTGIIGPNGAGKTTILEAIAWAIYGAPAVRGTKDTLRFNRALGRSTVKAELEFELRGERYRVIRTPRNAELYRAEAGDPIAAGIGEVSRQLTRRFGMTRREFFNTYFTGQRELQFLAAMGPTERVRFLSQVLGYERLRAAQNLVREQRKVLKGQVEELRGTLGDPDDIKRTKRAAEEQLKEASAALAAAERQQTDAASQFADVEPLWSELQTARERDRVLGEELRVAQARLERVLKERGDAEAELKRLEEAARQLEALREEARPLEALREEDEKLRVLSEAESQRVALQKQLEEQRGRIESLSKRVAEAEHRGREREATGERLAGQEEECRRLEAEREEVTSRWQRDAQDVDARLRMFLDQATELQKKIDELESEGPDGVCPTCRRPLGEEYDRVLSLVRAQREEIVQDGKWHRKRQDQLKAEPDDVVAAKRSLAEAREELEKQQKELADADSALSQAAAFKSELEGEEARARELAGEVAALAAGYDAGRHEEVRAGLKRLGELEKTITQVETRLEQQPRLRSVRAEAEEEERQIKAQVGELETARTELAFSEERYRSVGAEYESAQVALHGARVEVERARGDADRARGEAEAARLAEKEHKQVSRNIAEREKEHRLHNDLDGALGELRSELNNRVRPELSEIASIFLTELTDGRYNRIDISPNFDVMVLDDGEEKPVISGGEEDLANLVLRLAISQMIAERAGHTLSLLIFDEVFGGLDELRRDSVVRLLQRLQDRFEQVVLITHIESIREGMDQVVRVAYDERSGTSVVQGESPGAAVGDPEVADLAAVAVREGDR
jgi:exonuclease SbcC